MPIGTIVLVVGKSVQNHIKLINVFFTRFLWTIDLDTPISEEVSQACQTRTRMVVTTLEASLETVPGML